MGEYAKPDKEAFQKVTLLLYASCALEAWHAAAQLSLLKVVLCGTNLCTQQSSACPHPRALLQRSALALVAFLNFDSLPSGAGTCCDEFVVSMCQVRISGAWRPGVLWAA